MFGFRRKKSGDDGGAAESPEHSAPAEAAAKPGLFARLKAGLSKTRSGLTEGIAQLVLGRKQIDAALLDDIETQLLVADVGVEATQGIIEDLTRRVARKQLADAEALMGAARGHDRHPAPVQPSSHGG
jgi:fused signal recognition particle receptor